MGGEAPQVSCKYCKYNDNSKCNWFKYFKDDDPKEIPENVFNKGCKQFCDHPLLIEVLEIFK